MANAIDFGKPEIPFTGSKVTYRDGVVKAGNQRFSPGGDNPFSSNAAKRRRLIVPNSNNPGYKNGKPDFNLSGNITNYGTYGFRSNFSVPSGYVYMKPYKQGDEVPGPQDIGITKIDLDGDQTFSVEFGRLQNDTEVLGFTIPSFNYMLAINQKKADIPQMVYGEGPGENQINFHNIESILWHFPVQGVGETGSFSDTGKPAVPRNSKAMGYVGDEPRRTQFISSGRVSVKNMFGYPDVNDHVWLVYKRIKLPESYITNSFRSHGGRHASRAIDIPTRATLVERPYQVIPYFSKSRSVPYEFRKYTELDGTEALARCIHLGVVFKQPEDDTYVDNMIAARNLSYVNEQGTFEMSVTH